MIMDGAMGCGRVIHITYDRFLFGSRGVSVYVCAWDGYAWELPEWGLERICLGAEDDADVLAPTCIYLCNLVASGQHISAGCASSGLAQLQSSFFR